MLRTLLVGLTTASILVLTTQKESIAQTLDDQWYAGFGGGISTLKPKAGASEGSIDTDSEEGSVFNVIIGRDFDRLSSGQLQFFSLGEASFDNGETVDYEGLEASLLYRFYDSRDNRRGQSVLGASVYGRFGIGYMQRDSELDLNNDTPAYFGAGAGVETYLTRNIGLRLEAQYFDTDASAFTASLIARFGGYRNRLLASVRLPDTQTPPASQTNAAAQTQTQAAQARLAAQAEAERAAEQARAEAQAQLDAQSQQSVSPVPDTISPAPEVSQSETQSSPSGEVELFDQEDESNYVARIPESESGTQTDDSTKSAQSNNDESGTALPETLALPEVEILGNSAESDDDSVTADDSRVARAETSTPSSSVSRSGTLDSDLDGIVDANDRCDGSAPGFPVNLAGCGVFEGELTGLAFSADNNSIADGTAQSLDSFARLLRDYPRSRIEIVAHTDNGGTEAQQSNRTRSRLKAIGTYLVRRGASTDQLILRSFGAKRSKFDNRTTAGRAANNRIEVFERPR